MIGFEGDGLSIRKIKQQYDVGDNITMLWYFLFDRFVFETSELNTDYIS